MLARKQSPLRLGAPLLLGALLCFAQPFQATAQTQAQTDVALSRLAEILGALSHLEILCEQDERSRTDMEAVLALEDLSTTRQSVLIDAYNRGYRGVVNTHRRCTSASERLIELHHERGAAIVSGLLD